MEPDIITQEIHDQVMAIGDGVNHLRHLLRENAERHGMDSPDPFAEYMLSTLLSPVHEAIADNMSAHLSETWEKVRNSG